MSCKEQRDVKAAECPNRQVVPNKLSCTVTRLLTIYLSLCNSLWFKTQHAMSEVARVLHAGIAAWLYVPASEGTLE